LWKIVKERRKEQALKNKTGEGFLAERKSGTDLNLPGRLQHKKAAIFSEALNIKCEIPQIPFSGRIESPLLTELVRAGMHG